MKRPFLIAVIVIFSVLFGQVACSRKKTIDANSSASAETAKTTEGDRSQARVYLDQGKEFYRTDQDEKAAEAFKQAIKLDPELAEAHFRLGLAYDAVGKEKEAEDEYKKAIEKYKKYLEANSKDAEAHYNMGQAYAGLHLYSEAVREYRLATHVKTDDADIYYDLGTALMKLAQYDEAAAAFSKSLEIDPENYRAEDSLAEAREGVERIKAGKKHQEDLLKKQKGEENKNANGDNPESATLSSSKSNSNKSNSNRNRKP
ncbi:MAG: tetratricopeptide repeat protein [Acidobacteriota bacterium]|nr:tetratricopeptide repeat protein [Acidobacteriota bacterium]